MPSFDPAPFLDADTATAYADPRVLRVEPSEKPLFVRLNCSTEEQSKFFQLLDDSERFDVHDPAEVDPAYDNGGFTVYKDEHNDRFILDARVPNLFELALMVWTLWMASL